MFPSLPPQASSHTKPSCQFCGMRFRSPAEMTRHVRTHTGEKPFVCPTCHYAANRKAQLKKHCMTVHGISGEEFQANVATHFSGIS